MALSMQDARRVFAPTTLFYHVEIRCAVPRQRFFFILEPVLGRAAGLSAPGTKLFNEQGKLPKLCLHIRARLARLPSR